MSSRRSLAAAIALLGAGPALAGQDAASTAAGAPRSAPGATAVAGELADVVVTGSRIAIAADQAVTPLVVLDAPELERRRPDSLGDVLQQLPSALGAQQNTNVNNGGNGSTRLSLRALGDARTLMLLNGRRLPNSGVGGDASVDLNTLPTSLVERVEVLTAGASAVYGADAVAGVVNVITRDAAPGFGVRLDRSIATRGDGEIVTAQASAGAELLGGTWLLGADWVRQDGVKQDARAYSAVPLSIVAPGGAPVFVGSPNSGSGQITVPGGNALGLAPGQYAHVGTPGERTAANYRLFGAADTFNFAPFNYLQTPNERGTVWLLGTRPVAAAELFLEATYHRRESSQRLAPSPYVTGPTSAPSLGPGRTGIPANNFYNPFRVDVPRVARRFVELDERGFDQDVRAWRALLGARGEAGRWRWEVAGAESRGESDVDERGLVVLSRLVPALGPSGRDAGGRIVCGRPDPATGVVPAAAIVAGCVPVDLFGGAGSITPAMLDYVSTDLADGGGNRQRYFDAGVEGPWGALPAGEVRWALGAEWRRDSTYYDLDPLRLAGVAGGGTQPLPDSSATAREAYAEARAPLLADAAFAHALDLVGALRWSDFTSFGSATTWSAGLHWRPADGWNLRAVHSQVFRAPSLNELYRSNAPGVGGGPDPCGNRPTPAQQVNCARDGVPGGQYVQPPFQTWQTVLGGNPRLRPERGTSSNAGVTWSSSALRLSLDWYRIELPGFIAAPPLSDILFECAERGLAIVCGRIERNADGSIRLTDVTPGNFGRVTTSGVDHAGSAALAALGGDLTLGWRASWLDTFTGQPFPGGTVQRLAGRFAPGNSPLPRWRAGADAAWTRAGLRLGYALQYVGSWRECGGGQLPASACRDVDQAVYHDVDASYAFANGLRAYGGVRNALDREPPYAQNQTSANTEASTYRLLGRTWYAGVAFDWR